MIVGESSSVRAHKKEKLMTAQPIIAVDVLDRLAGRADVREFTNPRAWEW